MTARRIIVAGLRSGGLGAALLCAGAGRADVPAGSVIVNVAQLTYAAGTGPATIDSNENRIVIAERLDVGLGAGVFDPLADGGIVTTTVLTNLGNGQEAFAITATASNGDARVVRIAYDTDGDGRYDPAHDAELSGGRTPVLAPGQTLALFVILTPGTTGDVTVTATAVTGAGAPGTSFPGMGDGGGEAVTGSTSARASVTVVLGTESAPTLTKSAVVTAPDGSARAVRGATITYTLLARFPGAIQTAVVGDPIPAGTAYAPASLVLDDVPLSDAADGDAGTATSTAITVALGDQPAGRVHTVRFKVIIQ